MHCEARFHDSVPSLTWGATGLLLSAMVALLVAGVLVPSSQAQTFKVIHRFTGYMNGGNLTMDAAGNLYGSACCNPTDRGAVFKLSRKDSEWYLTWLYTFTGGTNGANPRAVTFGPDGTLYGTTDGGGSTNCPYYGCGTVFMLRPPKSPCRTASCLWTSTVLYRFQGGADGVRPISRAVLDHAGNIYGVTQSGGQGNCYGYTCGIVYQLKRPPAGGPWTETILHRFTGGSDGGAPAGALILDQSGNLYGTTYAGGAYGYGTVFRLTPSENGWAENVLYSFNGATDGGEPDGSLVFDQAGNLYGITVGYGPGPTVVYKLSPSSPDWQLTVLYDGCGYCGPGGTLSSDASGNLYGTIYRGGTYYYGVVFELKRSNDDWSYKELHSFTGEPGDWGGPSYPVVIDHSGNVYGTANGGVIFEITP